VTCGVVGVGVGVVVAVAVAVVADVVAAVVAVVLLFFLRLHTAHSKKGRIFLRHERH
jgi:hypothetical protein